MRNWRALIIVAGILALIAVFVMFMSYISEYDTDTVDIPAGSGWYYFYEFYLPSGGNVDVEFQETHGTSVTVYLFNSYQYDRYVGGQASGSLYSYSGSSGKFSHTFESSDTYYMVFTHGVGATGTSQSVNVDFKMNGFDLVLFSVGILLLIVADCCCWSRDLRVEAEEGGQAALGS